MVAVLIEYIRSLSENNITVQVRYLYCLRLTLKKKNFITCMFTDTVPNNWGHRLIEFRCHPKFSEKNYPVSC